MSQEKHAFIYYELVFKGTGEDQNRLLDLVEEFFGCDKHEDQECPIVHYYSTSRGTEEDVMENLVFRGEK